MNKIIHTLFFLYLTSLLKTLLFYMHFPYDKYMARRYPVLIFSLILSIIFVKQVYAQQYETDAMATTNVGKPTTGNDSCYHPPADDSSKLFCDLTRSKGRD